MINLKSQKLQIIWKCKNTTVYNWREAFDICSNKSGFAIVYLIRNRRRKKVYDIYNNFYFVFSRVKSMNKLSFFYPIELLICLSCLWSFPNEFIYPTQKLLELWAWSSWVNRVIWRLVRSLINPLLNNPTGQSNYSVKYVSDAITQEFKKTQRTFGLHMVFTLVLWSKK